MKWILACAVFLAWPAFALDPAILIERHSRTVIPAQNSDPCLASCSGSRPVRRTPMRMKLRGCSFMVPMMKCGWRVGMWVPYSWLSIFKGSSRVW